MFVGNFCGMKNLSFDIHTCDDRFAGEKIWGFGFRVSCSGFYVSDNSFHNSYWERHFEWYPQ